MNHIENYLRDVRDARATGEAVKETSFYPALSNLLNGVGAELNAKVRAVINLKIMGSRCLMTLNQVINVNTLLIE